MKRIAVLVILCFTTLTAAAQAPGDTLTVDGRFPKSYGAGYSSFAIGASAEFWKEVDERRRIFVGGKFGVDKQTKEYIGSGYTLRGSFHARIGLPFGQSWASLALAFRLASNAIRNTPNSHTRRKLSLACLRWITRSFSTALASSRTAQKTEHTVGDWASTTIGG